jgi:ABC-2 type transport system ATP-binding protein
MSKLKVENLNVKIGKTHILKNVNFELPEGVLCAFIGSNGAGKTTTIKSIVGLYPYNDGKITINDVDAKKYQSRYGLGYVPEKENFPKVKVGNFLQSCVDFFHIDKVKSDEITRKLLEAFGISDLVDKRLNKLSSGQKKKILIIQGLLHNPDLLIMDEPTENMDPDARMVFYQIIEQLKQEKKTIFVSTHNLDEIQKHADYIIIIRSGEILFTGAAQGENLYEIYRKYIGTTVEETTSQTKPEIKIGNIFGSNETPKSDENKSTII